MWVICMKDAPKLNKLMSNIKSLVILNQKRLGQTIINYDNLLDKNKRIAMQIRNDNEKEQYAQNDMVNQAGNSSHWVKIQDWSTCSLACGNGTQTLHRICVKTMPNATDCVGSDTLTRPCNVQPCPSINTINSKNSEKAKDPIVKVLPFSQRYQRYIVINFNNIF